MILYLASTQGKKWKNTGGFLGKINDMRTSLPSLYQLLLTRTRTYYKKPIHGNRKHWGRKTYSAKNNHLTRIDVTQPLA